MEFMNEHTRESLSMEYVLKNISPITPYGLQKKNELLPFKIGEEEKLEREYDKLEAVIRALGEGGQFSKILTLLRGVKEIRGSLKRAGEGLALDEVEFFEVKQLVFSLRDISIIFDMVDSIPEELRIRRIVELEELLDPEKSGIRTFYIYDIYSQKLESLRGERRFLQGQLDSERRRIFNEVEGLLGTKPKLNGEVTLLKKDTEGLERARKCPYLSEGAGTILSISFKVKNTKELEEFAVRIEELKLNEEREEYGVRKHLTSCLKEELDILFKEILKLGELDFLIAKARFALSIGGKRPILQGGVSVSMKEGRHIKLQEVLNKRGKAFVPIGFEVKQGVTVITGANMGGKTVSMKTAGMLVAMAQYGLFVPALEFKTCLFNYIYFSIGDRQSLDSGLSTFGSEIMGMKNILEKSEDRGLILIDELARGTNPSEGYAISRAIVKFLRDREAVTMFTTHFDGITHEMGVEHLQVRGLKGVDINSLMEKLKGKSLGMEAILEHMDYTLERVSGNYSVPEDAISIAKLMGLDDRIIVWAQEILRKGQEE